MAPLYHPRPERWPQLRFSLRALFVAVTLAALLMPWVISRCRDDGQSAVPWQMIWIYLEDEDGIASIRSKAFCVAFAGRSFGSRRSSGEYAVDGRYGFGSNRSYDGQIGDGVDWTYSQHERLATFRYQGHEIKYSHALNNLTVDHHEYSTERGQVRLLIKASGEVAPVGK